MDASYPHDPAQEPFRQAMGDDVGREHRGPRRVGEEAAVDRAAHALGSALEASSSGEPAPQAPAVRVPTSPDFVGRRGAKVIGDQQQLQVIDGTRFYVLGRHLRLRPEWVRAARHELERLMHSVPDIRSMRVEITGGEHHHLGYFEVQVTLEVASLHLSLNHHGPRVLPLVTYLCSALRRKVEEQMTRWEGQALAHESSIHRGSVKFVRKDEGYGFLHDDDGSEVYFHLHAIKSEQPDLVRAGTRVRFGIEDGDKGLQATWVRVEPHHGSQ
jgi:cold shock CspA family protein